MPFTKDSSSKDETSGLHDLQAMASSAKKRRSQRMSSQMDAQDSLLQSTAALEAVVLPDPNKEQAVSIAEVAPTAAGAEGSDLVAATALAAAPVARLDESKSSGKGLYIGLAVAAAVAAGAFFMLGGQDDASTELAATPVAAAAPAVADPAPVPEAPPVPAVVDDEPEESDVDPNALDEGALDEETPVAELASDSVKTPAADGDKKSEKHARSKTDEKSKAGNDHVATAAADKKKAEPAAKVEKAKVADESTPKLDSNSSLDDVLSSVTGGVDKPIAKKEDDGAPTLTKLGRSDVAKAMKKISPAAKACYKVEEFSGMVKIKYSVGSDGTVTKAAASGAHASSKTGQCVVNAVKKAKFPPFSGATTSFTFPFLLSP